MSLRIALHVGFIASIAAFLLAWDQGGTLTTVRLEVNSIASLHQTRYTQVDDILREAGVVLHTSDTVEPPIDTAAHPGEIIRVRRAIPVAVTAENASAELWTAGSTVRDVLREAGMTVGPYDTLALSGRDASPQALLRSHLNGISRPTGDFAGSYPTTPTIASTPPLTLEVRRALPVYIHDRGFITEVLTLEHTVQGALTTAGIELNPEDIIYPSREATVNAGQHIYLQRAKEVRLWVAGVEHILHTFAETVDTVLEEAGVQLSATDRVTPHREVAIKDSLAIIVTRVQEERVVLDLPLPYTTEYVADSTLEYGEGQVVQAGAKGLLKRQTFIVYENGREVQRTIEKEWVEKAPQTAVIHYGTKIVLRTVETPEGTQEYWRTMRVWATYYTPASSGKPKGHPAYGITRLGLEAKKGIIAVDPTVIPFYTRLFVPGYGVGIAADTGGGIIGKWIDLAYADEDDPDWATAWVDIYFLGAGPDPTDIRPPSP